MAPQARTLSRYALISGSNAHSIQFAVCKTANVTAGEQGTFVWNEQPCGGAIVPNSQQQPANPNATDLNSCIAACGSYVPPSGQVGCGGVYFNPFSATQTCTLFTSSTPAGPASYCPDPTASASMPSVYFSFAPVQQGSKRRVRVLLSCSSERHVFRQ